MKVICFKEVKAKLRITCAKAEKIHYFQEVLILFKAPTSLLLHSLDSPSLIVYVMFQKMNYFRHIYDCRYELLLQGEIIHYN